MSKFKPHSTTVSIGGTTIGNIISLGVPDESKGEAETTDNESGGDREFLPGLRDAGEMTIDVRWNPDDTGQQALDTNYEADDTTAEFIITLPSTATTASGSQTITFDGFVSGRSASLDLVADEAADRSYTVRVTGLPTIA